MYAFLDFTPDEQHERRQLLDYYGALAQISALAPLLVLQLFALGAWVHRKWLRRTEEIPGSPHAKERRLGRVSGVRIVASGWRRVQWWCGDEFGVLGMRVGTKGEVLGAVGWGVWLMALCFVQTGEDYLHLTKRFGIVAASQLPFHYLLSLKSPCSPLQILTHSSHETLIALHQLLGRLVTAFFYLHAAFYVYFFVQKELLATKLTQAYILCGVLGTVAFTIIGTTALAPVRKRNYRLFYVAHVAWATAVLPLLYFHVHHIRIYIWETLLVYVVNAALRYASSTTYSGTLARVPGTNLVEVSITLPKEAGNRRSLGRWQAGQHAYISLAGHPLLRTFRSNPFTVASLPDADGQLRFVARILDGITAALAGSAKSTQKITVEGPYGVRTHADRLLQYDRVLFMAGGVGATFVAPLYRQLLGDLSPGKGSHRRQKISFVWSARSLADVVWALPSEAREREGFAERLRVYLTKDVGGVPAEGDVASGSNNDSERVPAGESEEGIELEERKELLSSDADGTREKGTSGLVIQAGRPDLARVVEQVFMHGNAERVAVIVCGPKSLSRDLRQEVGLWVKKEREVWFWDESFSL